MHTVGPTITFPGLPKLNPGLELANVHDSSMMSLIPEYRKH
jgi:hypothetical protein